MPASIRPRLEADFRDYRRKLLPTLRKPLNVIVDAVVADVKETPLGDITYRVHDGFWGRAEDKNSGADALTAKLTALDEQFKGVISDPTAYDQVLGAIVVRLCYKADYTPYIRTSTQGSQIVELKYRKPKAPVRYRAGASENMAQLTTA